MSTLKKILSRSMVVAMTLLPASLVMAPACSGQAGDLCDDRCTCVNCNDREEELCVVTENIEIDRAAAYDCVAEYDTYVDCVISDSDCDDYIYSIDQDCLEDLADYAECVDDNSDIIDLDG